MCHGCVVSFPPESSLWYTDQAGNSTGQGWSASAMGIDATPKQAGPKAVEPTEHEASKVGIPIGMAIGASIIIGDIPICIGCCAVMPACEIAAGTKHTTGAPQVEALHDIVAKQTKNGVRL